MMNRFSMRVVLTIALGISSIAGAAGTLLDSVPADALAVAGWSGASEQEKVKLATIQEFVEALSADNSDAIEHGVSLLVMAMEHPTVAAVTRLDMEKEKFDLVLLIDLGKDANAFRAELESFVAALADGESFEPGTIPGTPFRWMIQDGKCTVWMGTQPATPETPISQHKPFLTRMETLRGTTAGNLWLYADLGVLKTELLKGRYADELGPILQAIGLDKADALALDVNFAETQFTCQMRLFSPAPHTGLLKMLKSKPITAKDIRHMPADTDFALVANLPFPTMLDQVADMVDAAMGPRDGERFVREIQRTNQKLGFDMSTELLGSLGETMTLSMAESRGGMLTSLMFTVEVTDAKTLGGVMSKVETLLDDEMTFRSIKQGKTPIRVGRLTDSGFLSLMIQPSWMIYDNQLRIALWPQVLMGSMTNKSPRLSANKEYQSLLASLDKDPSILLFSNDRLWMKRLYPLLLVGGSMLEKQIPVAYAAPKEKMFQAFFDSPVFPAPVQTMVANSGVSGCSIKVDDQGLAIRFVSKGKNAGLTQSFLVGLIAGVTIPQFASSASDAERSACMCNGKAIVTAGSLYRLKQNKDPQTITDLVNAGMLPHVPQCSKGGTYSITDGTCSAHSRTSTRRIRTGPAAKSTCRANQKAIQTACALYQLKEGKRPKTIADLTTPTANNSNRAYLPSAPKCPSGGVYDLQGKCTKHR